MELKNAIKNRRSIRRFRDEPIDQGHLIDIITSGIEAPSAGNLQSRHFYVVRHRLLKKQLATAAFRQDFISQAHAVVVVCADSRIRKEYGSRGVDLYAPMDCAASIQNMMLMAFALGYGTCWVGAFDEKKVSAAARLPTHFRPVALMPIGVANESPTRPERMALEEACEFLDAGSESSPLV